jgi:catechol 2,3-dioxygenase-like lactoylglutathione lyase family enzyme
MAAELAALLIGDPVEAWAELGFIVDDGAAHISGVRHVLGGEKSGIRDWAMRGVDGASFDHDAIDGLSFGLDAQDAQPTPIHPNGVVGLDHVVIATPDLARTIEAFESCGIELRRTRESGTYGMPMHQAFFKVGDVILEIIGSPKAAADGPLRFFGLAWTVRDLDETARFYGDLLRPAKAAVQPGRRIATLDKSAGSTVAMAFMTPEPPR